MYRRTTAALFYLLTIWLALCLASSRQHLARQKLFVDDEEDDPAEGSYAEGIRVGDRLAKQHLRMRNYIKEGMERWNSFKEEHGKHYEDQDMDYEHMLAYLKNMEKAREHNSKGTATFRMGSNHIADLPYQEYKKLNGYKGSEMNGRRKGSTFMAPFNVDVPDHWDWRDHGLVTEIKNQGMCGSCWAFSSTGALEGQHMRKNGTLVSLSEQNLVDCSRKFGNNGCNGGLMDYAFEYIKQNHGIDTEESYPYKGVDMKCHFKKRSVGAVDYGFVDLPEEDEEQLKIAVATVGPISVAIDAGHRSFQMYREGVYFEPNCSPEGLDHGVLVVGYGTDSNNHDYWIVKNSWGSGWGEHGYIRMARNRENHCGIASKASYPIV